MSGGLYILHFAAPVPYENCKRYGDELHYVGISANLEQRLKSHAGLLMDPEGNFYTVGSGSAMTRAAMIAGIPFTVARIIPCKYSTKFETKITKLCKVFCGICQKQPIIPIDLEKLIDTYEVRQEVLV